LELVAALRRVASERLAALRRSTASRRIERGLVLAMRIRGSPARTPPHDDALILKSEYAAAAKKPFTPRHGVCWGERWRRVALLCRNRHDAVSRVIQMLLGHRSIRSTARYTHLTSRVLAKTKSPVDVLGTPKQKMIG
jgi:integrase